MAIPEFIISVFRQSDGMDCWFLHLSLPGTNPFRAVVGGGQCARDALQEESGCLRGKREAELNPMATDTAMMMM